MTKSAADTATSTKDVENGAAGAEAAAVPPVELVVFGRDDAGKSHASLFGAADAIAAVKGFDRFDGDNDPHGEHDFGAVTVGSARAFWKTARCLAADRGKQRAQIVDAERRRDLLQEIKRDVLLAAFDKRDDTGYSVSAWPLITSIVTSMRIMTLS